MNDVVVGDSIVFESVLVGTSGSAITNAVTTLRVNDATGSLVLNQLVSHTTTGTYQYTASTSGWSNGPINEYWKFTNSAGTATKIVGNKFRIVGTSTLEAYVRPHELYAYYENVENYFDGSEDQRVIEAFDFINQQLNSLGYKTPVSKGSNGYFDQALRDWNAYDAIYRIVYPRAVAQTRDSNDTPWFDSFKKRADEKWNDFKSKKIVLNIQTSPSEAGIGRGTKVAGSLYGNMETNWEGYGYGFKGADFPRTWRVEILGTGTAGQVDEGTYRWSMDNGITWVGTGVTSQSWLHLQDEVYIRFTRGTHAGTTGLYTVADAWQFNTAPLKISTGGKHSVNSY